MLLKTGINLTDELLNYIDTCSALSIYVPYIKLSSLEQLLGNTNKCKFIVVRWEPKDLILGSSDLDVYLFCKERNITLYRNSRIHLKAFVDQYKRCLLGSANISSRALNMPETNLYNYELATLKDDLMIEDKLYFETILNDSTLITDSIYGQIKKQLTENKVSISEVDDFSLEVSGADKDFLISSLPMSSSVNMLVQVYRNPYIHDKVDVDCMIHDLALYKIPLGLDQETFKRQLMTNFFKQKFVEAFLDKLRTHREMYFGQVSEWIHHNCTDVPTPRRFEIKDQTQILYSWIEELGNGRYIIDRPNHSQRIRIGSDQLFQNT